MKRNKRKILRRSLIISFILVGTVLIWRGLWEISENFISAEQSLALGSLILLLIGFFARKALLRSLGGF